MATTPTAGSLPPGEGDTICISGGGIRATLVGMVALDELGSPTKRIVPTVEPGIAGPPTLTDRVFAEVDRDAKDLAEDAKSFFSELPKALRRRLKKEEVQDDDAAAAAAAAAATAPEAARKWKYVNDEASPKGIQIPAEKTFGASGGAWCVLIHEVAGPNAALQNALNFIVGSGEGIGWSFGKEALRVGNKWLILDKYWSPYVEEVIDSMITPFSPEVYRQSHAERRLRVLAKLAGDGTEGRANVTVGVSTRGFLHWFKGTENVLTLQRNIGWFESKGATSVKQLASHMKFDKVPYKTATFDFPLGKQRIDFDRLVQAGLTSTAYVGVDSELVKLCVAGLGAGVRFAGASSLEAAEEAIDCSLWDLGLKCNNPVTPRQLHTAGTSLVIDASNDKKIFKSMNACIDWWKKEFDLLVEPVADPATAGPNGGPIVWNGYTLDFKRLDPALSPFVNVYMVRDKSSDTFFKPTGRIIVAIAIGRIRADGSLVSEQDRLRLLETTHMTSLGETARVFYKSHFDLINTEVRRFYRQVLAELGLPRGSYEIFDK